MLAQRGHFAAALMHTASVAILRRSARGENCSLIEKSALSKGDKRGKLTDLETAMRSDRCVSAAVHSVTLCFIPYAIMELFCRKMHLARGGGGVWVWS